ncbi:hypothetical protein GBF38_007428 [Xyrichtys novacula]|uniref:Uncharacterized protein n=1 Tax=Xyrichtys novacula TaxID=13765 RepID=A0AAV1GRH2_XYRNO|nr:hypothetical protein GBF38_007428 [Xyrichtys novacula]
MSPLTSPHRCDGCLKKSRSIAQLERRISDLHWIRNEEKLLDSVITFGAGPPVKSELDSTIPVWDAGSPAASVCQPSPGPAILRPQPDRQPRAHHISNPMTAGYCWVQSPNACLLLLQTLHHTRGTECVVPARSRRPGPPFQRGRPAGPVHNSPVSSSCPTTTPSQPDRIKVRFFNAVTRCLPGATVPVILNELPGLLRSLPATVSKVIVHVGCNDTARKQSELLKIDFRDLLSLLRTTGKAVFISGPIPTLARGAERFSGSLLICSTRCNLPHMIDYCLPHTPLHLHLPRQRTVLLHSTLPPMDLLFTSTTTLFNIPSQYTSVHVITPINTSPPLRVHGPGCL